MPSTSDPVRVGVLSLHNSKETKAILNAVEDLGHRPEWLRQENTVVGIEDGEVTLEPAVDVIVNRLLLSNTPDPAEGLGLAATFDRIRPTLNPPAAVLRAVHKFATATTLADRGIRVPDALLALSSERLEESRDRFGGVAVYKTAIGTHGGGTWRVAREDPVTPQVGNRQAFLQAFVETGERHRDLRVYVVDGRIVGAMHRYAPEGEWRTNVALGGDVENVPDVDEAVRETALTATDILGLDYAGVDIVDGDEGPAVLEVNPTAGFTGLYRATGSSPGPRIAATAIERAGGEVDDERVAELSATLDDSTPACKPRPPATAPRDTPVIGFTERVVVTGTAGSREVVGKSDTGATRTSIDTSLAADIGAGPIKSMTRVRSGSNRSGKARPVVDLVIGIGGSQHTVTASVEDRSHMDYPLLLGRDVLEHYQVDVRRQVDDSGAAGGGGE